MEPIRFRCASCNQSLRVRADEAGRNARCNRCQTPLVVPEAEDAGATADEAPAQPTTRPREETERRVRPPRAPAPVPADEGNDADAEAVEQRPRRRKKK